MTTRQHNPFDQLLQTLVKRHARQALPAAVPAGQHAGATDPAMRLLTGSLQQALEDNIITTTEDATLAGTCLQPMPRQASCARRRSTPSLARAAAKTHNE